MTQLFFDVGGTWTHIANSTDGQTLSGIKRIKTVSTPEKFLAQLQDYTKSISGITAIAGGVRGVLNEEKTGIEHDHILTMWQAVDLVELLTNTYNVEVQLENDAALAGLGEALFGAGQGIEVVVYHDISTGVGGARLVNGAIDNDGVAFEPGLQIIDVDRTVLGDDVPPTLENLISGRMVAERMGSPAPDIPQDDVIWNELAEYLASGLRNSILYWSPEVIVLGGAMITGNPHIPLDNIRQETVKVLNGVVDCPFITISSLKQDAGLYGALALLTK